MVILPVSQMKHFSNELSMVTMHISLSFKFGSILLFEASKCNCWTLRSFSFLSCYNRACQENYACVWLFWVMSLLPWSYNIPICSLGWWLLQIYCRLLYLKVLESEKLEIVNISCTEAPKHSDMITKIKIISLLIQKLRLYIYYTELKIISAISMFIFCSSIVSLEETKSPLLSWFCFFNVNKLPKLS